MNSYRILIVDDEPAVVDSARSLMEKQNELSLDIYVAYRASSALAMLEKGKFDIIITDIEMPEMNGLELVEQVRKLWPLCKAIILTAYSEFQYAKQAIQQGVSAFIIKSETREKLLDSIKQAIDELNEDMQKRIELSSRVAELGRINRRLFLDMLFSQLDTIAQGCIQAALGFSKSGGNTFALILAISRDKNPLDRNLLANLFQQYGNHTIIHFVCEQITASQLTLMIEYKSNMPSAWLSGLLETIQSAYISQSVKQQIAFIYTLITKSTYAAYALVSSYAEFLSSETELLIFQCTEHTEIFGNDFHVITVQRIKTYINEHVSEDPTLMELAAAFGYNPSYLSWLFKEYTGISLKQYIIQKRMELIKRSFANPNLSIKQIAENCGFNSHSYFCRYIRQETGLSPSDFRRTLLTK